MRKFRKRPGLAMVHLPGHGRLVGQALVEGEQFAKFVPALLEEVFELQGIGTPPSVHSVQVDIPPDDVSAYVAKVSAVLPASPPAVVVQVPPASTRASVMTEVPAAPREALLVEVPTVISSLESLPPVDLGLDEQPAGIEEFEEEEDDTEEVDTAGVPQHGTSPSSKKKRRRKRG